MSTKAEKRRKKYARAKARKEQVKQALLISSEERFKHVKNMGQSIISAKFQQGKGKSRHQGKIEDNNFAYITSEKSFRDISATWRRFSMFVAEHSDGTDLNDLEAIMKYVDNYIQHLLDLDRSAFTLTTYKANLGKVFGVSTTAFMETPKRERRNKKRSRQEANMDHKVSKGRREFFEKVGSAIGLRRKELEMLRGTDIFPKRAKNGLYYLNITRGTKGGRVRKAPIMARNEEELQWILSMFRQAGDNYVFSGRNGTYRVPKNFDEHYYRSVYATRVYLHYERDLETLPRSEKCYLRKEYKGYVLDKYAEAKTTEALGHSRIDEVRASYLHILLN